MLYYCMWYVFQLVMTGLISSIKSMGSILLVTVLVLIIFSVIGVDIFRVYMHLSVFCNKEMVSLVDNFCASNLSFQCLDIRCFNPPQGDKHVLSCFRTKFVYRRNHFIFSWLHKQVRNICFKHVYFLLPTDFMEWANCYIQSVPRL